MKIVNLPDSSPRSNASAADLAVRFAAARAATDALVAPLSPEDAVAQAMPDASPSKWHLAHTTWFFETFILERFEPNFVAFAPAFRELFNSYYVGVGARHPRTERGLLTRPSLDEVKAYRRHVESRIRLLLGAREIDPELAALVALGIQHEQQHQELILTDLKFLLSRNPLQPAYAARTSAVVHRVAPDARWLRFPAGLAEIGHGAPGEFAFDNESPRHELMLNAFEIADRPVSNGEFRAFIEAGGYDEAQWWLSEGWDVKCAQRWIAPLYWERDGDGWSSFTLAGRRTVADHEPVCHVSYFEADAYARWIGARLPTEAEWEVAAQSTTIAGTFLESGRFHPASFTAPQMFGDVWQWTSSSYAPFPGFRPAPGAVGEYNGKFMVNQYVLRGGSCATPQSHIRASYRNFFPTAARWQFSGLRLARDVA